MSTKRQKNGTYVTTLADFGGLDLTGGDAGATPRFSRLENMWRDYGAGEGDALESFPGFRVLATLPGTIRGCWQWNFCDEEYLLVHAGRSLYYGRLADTDNLTLTEPLTCLKRSENALADAPSCGFHVGGDFYLLDGAHYYTIRPLGTDPALTEVKDLYIPTTYSDGEPYEQYNMLSRFTLNRYHIGAASSHTPASRGLHYRVLDEHLATCEVTGVDRAFKDADLYIPAEATIGGVPYRVTRVAWKAFSMLSHIKRVYIAEGIEAIDIVAFASCKNLVSVYLPDSLTHILRRAFVDCTSLETVVLGSGLERIDEEAFRNTGHPAVSYHGDADSYAAITIAEKNDVLASSNVTFLDIYPKQVCHFPLYEDISEVYRVFLDDQSLACTEGVGSAYYTVDYTDDGHIGGILLHADGDLLLTGRELLIKLLLTDTTRGSLSNQADFASASNGYDGTTHAAMAHCTQAATYDGRVFFTGNPSLANTVFYTARDLTGHINPTYVGVYNYFLCGDDTASVTALLPTASYLAVFTGERAGGRVTYYRGRDTSHDLVPRVYLAEDSVCGSGCVGVAATLRDDPVFLTYEGLEALSREPLNTERSLKHRSTRIDPALVAHDPRSALHAIWEGYLFLLYPDGEAYLADSRRIGMTSRGEEYEWYHLSGVGCYTDDIPVYRYADAYYAQDADVVIYDGVETPLSLHPHADALPFGADASSYPAVYPAILHGSTPDGTPIAFTREGEGSSTHLYLLRRTDERTGGVFSPPTSLSVIKEKLYIGCQNGCLAVVNTDLRGVMNEAQSEVYTPDAYLRQWGRLINPAHYSYAGHRYLAGLATLPDDNGISNYTKGTLRGTTVLEMKAGVGYGFSIEVRLFRTTGPESQDILHTSQGCIDFTALDFGSINFGACEDCTIVLNERSRRYLKKQYCLFSDAFAQPFGLCSISYTWQTEGKVKNV